jgi:GT2 family glycosyltransferase
LSIIIVSYNARIDLEACLGSLAGNPPAAAHEVIVVDNASGDGSAAAARHWSAVRVIEMATNVGFAAGNNVGIRASSGRTLLLLNSDTLVPPGTIDALLAELDRDESVAAVGPRLVDARGHAELSFGPMPTLLGELRRGRLMRRLDRGEPRAREYVEAATQRAHAPDWVTGACLLVRRADAEAVGLLDERFFMYTEDVDFCASLRARGRRILFVPSVQIVHVRGRSAAAAPAATRAAYHESHLAFYRKHRPWAVPFVWLYRVMAG